MIAINLAIKNIISRKSSLLITGFISFCLCLFFVANAIIDRSENGIKQNYINSLTGDIVIRPVAQMPYSLFGDETPITGSINKIPLVPDFSKICSFIENDEYITEFLEQYTASAVMEYSDGRTPVTLFGVNASEYFRILSSLKIESGGLFTDSESDGLLISKSVAEKYSLTVGSVIKILLADGLSSKIRQLTVKGIYSYPSENSSFDDLLLVSEEFVIDLMDYNYVNMNQDIAMDETYIEDFDIDSFFDEDNSTALETLDNIFDIPENVIEADINSCNFIICKLSKHSRIKNSIKKLNREFKQNNIQAEAVNWRNGAGNRATYIYILRLILNAGVYVILLVGFIIVNNTLVINVLDRIKEIGTIRAIGGKKIFICFECMMETLIISLFSFFIGVIVGSIIIVIINKLSISLNNSFLMELLAGKYLTGSFNFSNFAYCFMVSLLIGCISWVYPVITALKITPVEAMRNT